MAFAPRFSHPHPHPHPHRILLEPQATSFEPQSTLLSCRFTVPAWSDSIQGVLLSASCLEYEYIYQKPGV